MKILNESTTSEHLGIKNLQENKISILISNGINYESSDRRIVAPMYGKSNFFEIARSYKQANIRDIEIVIDSKKHPELSEKVLAENVAKARLPIFDLATGVHFDRLSSVQTLLEGYKLFKSTELADSISRHLIQKIPLHFETSESCLSHYLDPVSDGYQKLLNTLNQTSANYESMLSDATKVTEFDQLINVKTYDNASYLIEDNQYDTTVLLGHTGTGKTKHGLQPLIRSANENKRVVYISYLIPLVKQLCESVGAENYKNSSLFEIENATSLGVVVNSIYKDHLASVILNCDVLIIDEFEKVIANVCGHNDTMREEVFDVLALAIQKAPRVVVADADVTDTTLRWLREHRKSVRVIRATQNPYTNINVTVANKLSAFSVASTKLQDEKVILFDSLKTLRMTMIDMGLVDKSGQACEKAALKKKVLVLTGNNKNMKEQAGFLTSPTENCTKYKMIMASPCLASGYSCEAEYTDNVNVVSDLVLRIDELLNFSRRFRTSKNITFYLTLNDHFDYIPHPQCSADSDREILRKEFENKKKLFNANQPLSMMWNLKRLGFNVQVKQSSKEELEEGIFRFNLLKAMDLEARIKAILAARLITRSEAERLLMSNQVGFEELAMLKKYEIMRDYQLEEITEKDILFDESFWNKPLYKQIWNPNGVNQSKYLVEPAKFIKSQVLQNPDYQGKNDTLVLSRSQVHGVATKIYDNWETFKHLLPDNERKEDCTRWAATKLFRVLMSSLGYIWPKKGYQSEPKKVTISLDKRTLAYKNSLL
ncbi:DEAD/DEAH box helicase family protein [Vibrio natriegens]|uniref:DEAD/DEAH box helicase family protein n=1 Tax=Vibrio natriegens TaxID=691 RepID=UPI003909ABD1